MGKKIQLLPRSATFMSASCTRKASGLEEDIVYVTIRPGHYFKIMLGVI